MKLSEYIKKHGDSACAKRFGVKLRTVASWRRAERVPKSSQAVKIAKLTLGEVSLADIFG